MFGAKSKLFGCFLTMMALSDLQAFSYVTVAATEASGEQDDLVTTLRRMKADKGDDKLAEPSGRCNGKNKGKHKGKDKGKSKGCYTSPPSSLPSTFPSVSPSAAPSSIPSASPSASPSTSAPSDSPSSEPTSLPSDNPSAAPSTFPSTAPSTSAPSTSPSSLPSGFPSTRPSSSPTTFSTCDAQGGTTVGDSCWTYVHQSLSWHDAENYCQNIHNGHLVSIHSSQEQDVLDSMCASRNCWIGYHDKVIEGDYEWSDGSPDDYFHGWCSGNPTNNGAADDCIASYTINDCWYDWYCDGIFRTFVCSFPIDPIISAPSAAPSATCDVGGMEVGTSCWYYVPQLSSWNEAEAYCQTTYNGHLVSIHSPQEQDVLDSMCASRNCWIGYHDKTTEGDYEWSDGSPDDYFHGWCSGNPTNNGAADDCIASYTVNDCWYDWYCDGITRHFVCSGAPL